MSAQVVFEQAAPLQGQVDLDPLMRSQVRVEDRYAILAARQARQTRPFLVVALLAFFVLSLVLNSRLSRTHDGLSESGKATGVFIVVLVGVLGVQVVVEGGLLYLSSLRALLRHSLRVRMRLYRRLWWISSFAGLLHLAFLVGATVISSGVADVGARNRALAAATSGSEPWDALPEQPPLLPPLLSRPLSPLCGGSLAPLDSFPFSPSSSSSSSSSSLTSSPSSGSSSGASLSFSSSRSERRGPASFMSKTVVSSSSSSNLSTEEAASALEALNAEERLRGRVVFIVLVIEIFALSFHVLLRFVVWMHAVVVSLNLVMEIFMHESFVHIYGEPVVGRAHHRPDTSNVNTLSLPTEFLARIPQRFFEGAEDEIEAVDANCAICLCEYVSGEVLRVLPCHHHFHKECIDSWFERSSACPLCKRDVRVLPPSHEDEEDTRSETASGARNESESETGRSASIIALRAPERSSSGESVSDLVRSRGRNPPLDGSGGHSAPRWLSGSSSQSRSRSEDDTSSGERERRRRTRTEGLSEEDYQVV